MSAFSGPQQTGARRIRREVKRLEAEARNAKTLPERRKVNRSGIRTKAA